MNIPDWVNTLEIIWPETVQTIMSAGNDVSMSSFIKDWSLTWFSTFPRRYLGYRSMMNMYMIGKKFSRSQVEAWLTDCIEPYYGDDFQRAMTDFLAWSEEAWEDCPNWAIALVMYLEKDVKEV